MDLAVAIQLGGGIGTILAAAALFIHLDLAGGQAAVEVAVPDVVPGKTYAFGLDVGGLTIHPDGKRIAPLLDGQNVEHHGAGYYALVPHLLTNAELLGEIEADGILDQVAEEHLGAGIGKGVANIGIEQGIDALSAVGAAQTMNATMVIITAGEVGFVVDDIDPAEQETGPAGLLGDGPEICIRTVGYQ